MLRDFIAWVTGKSTTSDGTFITPKKTSKDWFRENKCPVCHQEEGFYEGPSGGMSTNIQCANPECGAWLNFTPLYEGHFLLEGIRGTILPEEANAN